MNTDVIRQQFESWADDQGYPMQRTIRGDDYQDLRTEGAHGAWQAALQSPAVRELMEAMDALLQDTQHRRHVCFDEDCPVARSRKALAPFAGVGHVE